MDNKLIFLELNEICISLIDPWINEGKLENFKELRDNSTFFNTLSDEDIPNLEPWIQWHSIHVGKSYDTHKIFELTDGLNCELENIWQALLRDGKNVASIGSMNVKNFKGDNSTYIPDPWCNGESTYPEHLQQSYDFISENVMGYSDKTKGTINKIKAINNLRKNGLTLKTILKILQQLFIQRINYKKHSWKQATLLDLIQFDLAYKIIKESKPTFITFFSNSVAHLQHAYWRYLQPEKFNQEIGKENQELYKDAVFYGYQRLDILLGKFIKIAAKHGYKLAACSALSQRPYVAYEASGGRHYYRLINETDIMEQLNINNDEVELFPIMAQEYKLNLTDPNKTDYYMDLLASVKSIDDKTQVFEVTSVERGVITFGCQLFNQIDNDFKISIGGKIVSFYDLFYKLEDIKSGEHDPSGLLYLPACFKYEKSNGDTISILDITPTIMKIVNPNYQSSFIESCEGKSLLAS